MRSLVVVTAGLSSPSTTRALADALSAATASQVTARGEGVDVTVVEVRELAGELADSMTNWGSPTPHLEAAQSAVMQADGLIAVSPVFQGSYSGLFKMFFDTFQPRALNGLPTLIAATGGCSRHALVLDYALRPLLNYLHATVVPTGVFHATEDYGTAEGARTEQRIERAARELADLMVRPRDRVAGLAGPLGEKSRAETGTDTASGSDSDPTGFRALLADHNGQPG
ncbi:FMN reductase [Corynebacterium sp. FDAARGOS 1242]|uniref:FMN reductase n=1 Tax=Corynebacterium sp. FDAARGOS 1242 TaxID=2778078 RepID=UPI001951591E|nr:FMN reductase [Corynebacterium sp. FDAARGOS 1242]QRP98698.1 FMN reductase [Corynebacterium sp. FDAARGOS 1242]